MPRNADLIKRHLLGSIWYYISFTADISQIKCYPCKKPPKSPLSGGLLETTCYENYPNRNGISFRAASCATEGIAWCEIYELMTDCRQLMTNR